MIPIFKNDNFSVPATQKQRKKMLRLAEELIAVEEDRAAGKTGCTLDELEARLDSIITQV